MTSASASATNQRCGARHLPSILCVAAFGDGASAFAPLQRTELASRYRLVAIDLPGFAGTPALAGPTTLEKLADVVQEAAVREGARTIVAHSLGSIIASLAARRRPAVIDRIVSLEGNLTAEDAYFSGTAADYRNAADFGTAFLRRLDDMAKEQPIVARYRRVVAEADPRALWELGCDARRFSGDSPPGEILAETPEVWYLYNPENCPTKSLEWLHNSSLKRLRMDRATHWKSVDQPHLLAEKIRQALKAQ